MSDDASNSNEVTFVYEQADGSRSLPVTGAQGGTSPDGASVVANLYVERASIPHHVSHQIESDGQINLEPSESVTRGEITREVQASLVMTPEHAIQIGQWLLNEGQKAMQARQQNFGDD
jgi:hypothetical protein